jgi:uncharacterized protein YjlB
VGVYFTLMEPDVELYTLEPRGAFPNNPHLPVVVYRHAVHGAAGDALAEEIERRFNAHDWSGGWRDGVYDYAHYHSTAHEVLGCYQGGARVELGGGAHTVELQPGDVLVLPAGVAHKNIGSSIDFAVVGAYAGGRHYDMRRGDPDEGADKAAHVPLPEQDPVYGREGPLLTAWR